MRCGPSLQKPGLINNVDVFEEERCGVPLFFSVCISSPWPIAPSPGCLPTPSSVRFPLQCLRIEEQMTESN